MNNDSIFSNSFTPTTNNISTNYFTPYVERTISLDFSNNPTEVSSITPTKSFSSASTTRRAEVSTKYTGTLKDYNKTKGKQLGILAEKYCTRFLNRGTHTIGAEGKSSSWSHGDNKINPLCAAYVKTAIKDAGLGDYESGDAYRMIDILSDNPNFKRIDATKVDISDLPAGCVLVYGKGVGGYSKKSGHTEISLGNGTCASQAITQNPESRGIPTAIFIPV